MAYQLDSAFKPYLRDQMAFFSNDKSADTINRLRGEVTEVKKITLENIEKVCNEDHQQNAFSQHCVARVLDTVGRIIRDSTLTGASCIKVQAATIDCGMQQQQQQ